MSQTLEALVVELRADVKGLQASLSAAAGDVQRFSGKASTSVDGFQASIVRARVAVLSLGAAWAAFRIGKGIVDAGIQLQAMQNKMEAATGSAAVAANSLAFVRDEANRLGLGIQATTDGFSSFAASSLRAGLTLQQTKEIFTGVSEAVTALQLSPERVSLVFGALAQMAAKGAVSMEELRQQMGESLPVAISTFAKAMGVSQAAFIKMVENGQVGTAELVKFGNALHRDFADKAVTSAEGARGAFARLGNAFFDLQSKMASAGILDAVTDGVRSMTAALNDPATVAGLVKLAHALATIAQIALQVGSAIGTMLYRIGEFETKALALVGLGAGAKGNAGPKTRIPVAPRPDTSGVSGDYTLGKIVMPAASADAKGEKARLKAAQDAQNLRDQLSGQVDSLRHQFASPEEQAGMDVERQQDTLRKALEAKAITEQEFRDLSLAAELDYQEQLSDIRAQAREQEQTALEAFLGVRLQSQQELNSASLADEAKSFAQSISMAAKHNQIFFQLEKARAIASALISAREAVVHAYNFGSRIGGPVLGATFAGVAAAAQAANIAAIASTSYNSGGSVGSSGGDGGDYSGGGDYGGSVSSAPTKIMQITLVGSETSQLSKNQVRDLIDLINDAQRDGSRVQVVNA